MLADSNDSGRNNNNNNNNNNNDDNSNRNKIRQLFPWSSSSSSSLDNQTISKIRASLGFFAVVDATWHLAVFAACYRYRPIHKFSQTATGQRWMHRLQKMRLWNKTNNNNNQQQNQAPKHPWLNRVPGGQRTMVAASEWFVVNKTIGMPLLPTRLWLATWLSKQEFFGNQQQHNERRQHDLR
eukprot:scaffold31109_cov175-Amphora_coffeaeformis.AAC.5